MHAGTVLLSLLAVVGAACIVYGWWDDGYTSGFVFLGGGIVMFSLFFLLVIAVNTRTCDIAGSDYGVDVDFSWLRGCRTPAVVDGHTVLVPFDDFRFYSDLELQR